MAQKKRLQVLPSSWRGKKRYIAFRLLCDSKLPHAAVDSALWETFLGLFGHVGVSEQRLWLVVWSAEHNAGIVRCALKELDRVKAGFLFLQHVGEHNVVPELVTVSGSLKKAKQKLGVSRAR